MSPEPDRGRQTHRRDLSRRRFLGVAAAGITGSLALRPGAAAGAGVPPRAADLVWHDVEEWGVEGRGWAAVESYYDRLPAEARGRVREPVWELSRDSAGLSTRFETDSPQIHVRYTLRSDALSLPHMPATGVSGVDLYAEDAQGRWHWVSVVKPTAREMQTPLVTGLEPGRRAYLLYLPLYNGVERMEIGIDRGVHFAPIAPRRASPIVFYGTSILQGGCASRPGMAFTAILGRRLDLPTVNLGFSGNGEMEMPLAELMGQLDARAYVVDCLPNLKADQVARRTEPFVRRLRALRPRTPIVLVEDRTYAGTVFVPRLRRENEAGRAALRAAYESLVRAGVGGLHYVPGERLLGDDGEATVDGSHPSDLGMVRYADALEPVLRTAIRD